MAGSHFSCREVQVQLSITNCKVLSFVKHLLYLFHLVPASTFQACLCRRSVCLAEERAICIRDLTVAQKNSRFGFLATDGFRLWQLVCYNTTTFTLAAMQASDTTTFGHEFRSISCCVALTQSSDLRVTQNTKLILLTFTRLSTFPHVQALSHCVACYIPSMQSDCM